jgi:glycosyltransferase involved in cell wall biosynthesis
MTKLLWHSNAPWTPTGYGSQTGLFAPYLAERYDLAISSFFGLEGAPLKWEGIPVLPGMGGASFGAESMLAHAEEHFDGDPRGGLVATLMDVWVLDPHIASQMNLACWVPVDHTPAPPNVVDFFIKSGATPIAMSKFGQAMLGRLDPLYCPHGIDTDVYKPYDRKAAREKIGLPEDAFLVGMVAANKGRPSRKSFSPALQAFRKFLDKHENAYLYLHTMMSPSLAQGENLPGLIDALGIPLERIRTADQYRILFKPHPPETMALLYSAMDCLLNPSMGEGFGITVLEAQACGVPAIVTEFSAMKEVCGAGWHVNWDPYWTGQNAWQATPDVDDIAEALGQCHDRPPREREQHAEIARKHALEYSLPRVLKEHMLPALRIAEQRFRDRDPVTVAPRLKAAA